MRMSLPQERTHSSRGLYTYSGAVAGGGGRGSGWVPGGVPAFTDTRYKRLVTKAKVTVLTAKLIVLRGPSLKTFECQNKHVSVDKLIN